jgi:hypothetical protein
MYRMNKPYAYLPIYAEARAGLGSFLCVRIAWLRTPWSGPKCHRFLRAALALRLSPARASIPAIPLDRFIGRGFRCLAHAFTSLARHTGVARSLANGSGKSGRCVHLRACVRVTFNIAATSASPTRSSGF